MRVATTAKWQLTENAFDRLLAAFDGDRDQAAQKYLLLKNKLTRFFETRGFQTAEEASDEVLNRLARKSEAGEIYENVNIYALGVARMLALELRKSPLEKTSNDIPEIGVSAFDAEAERREEKLDCLNHCLNELTTENRRIIVGYYQGEKREKIENRARLAQDLGVPQNALRNRAVRLRDKLENCISHCLKKL